jgi:uncharacterized protein YjbI with pentapeptide repeats
MDAALTAAAIGVGGTVIVGLAGFWANVRNTNKTTALTLRAVELTEQGQVTDRYARAVEQLGSDKLDVRIGGIYALERVARDSPRDQPTIIEVLAAFIREHSHEQWPLTEDGAEPPDRLTRPDVQAAATVIGRRTGQVTQFINLSTANLTRADLALANLPDVNLAGAHLAGAHLGGANLTGARLAGANLTGANLPFAQLPQADLTDAHLAGAFLAEARLTRARLTRADLTGANLGHADLGDADLTDAHLDRADLTRADLTRAGLTDAHLDRADLTDADLTDAHWPLSAVVPEGWRRGIANRLKRSESDSGDSSPG